MDFERTDYPPTSGSQDQNVCYLVEDNWDDSSFKTTFNAVLFDSEGARHALGYVRILERGLKKGRVPVPSRFSELSSSWCSLGAGREYYEAISKLASDDREIYLRSIRDCVFDQTIWQAFRQEEGMRASLLRDVSRRDVEVNFPRILRGDSRLTPYEFFYEFDAADDGTKERCDFAVKPESKPPSNIHVLIGRNGVGKTRLLAGMADALTQNEAATIGLRGKFSFVEPDSEKNEFLNIVVVSYSAFDRFDPIPKSRRDSETSIPYYYIGIKKREERAGTEGGPEEQVILKETGDFDLEFRKSLETIRDREKGSYSRCGPKISPRRRGRSFGYPCNGKCDFRRTRVAIKSL